MSYEDFVADFQSSEGIDDLMLDMENGKEIVAETNRLARENKHHGKKRQSPMRLSTRTVVRFREKKLISNLAT